MKKFKDVLYTAWSRVLPLLLILGFCVGVFFNLWKIHGIGVFASGVLCVLLLGGIGLGFTKLMKWW
jgi:hypothetical protein